jgi:hypothetical protein
VDALGEPAGSGETDRQSSVKRGKRGRQAHGHTTNSRACACVEAFGCVHWFNPEWTLVC